MSKFILPLVAGLVGGALVALLFVGGAGKLAGSIETLKVTFGDGFEVLDDDGSTVLFSVTNGGVLSLTGTAAVVGAVTVDEFTQGGGECTLTDANGGTYTVTQTELSGCNVLKFAAGGAGQEVIALQLPATSTLTAVIPATGDLREWIYDASALAAATTTTITAGTGMDLVGVTANDDVIDGAEWSRLTCWRQADTDVTCIVSELLHVD